MNNMVTALVTCTLLLAYHSPLVTADLADTDTMEMASESNSIGDDSGDLMEGGAGSDPNLLNPLKGQGYGIPFDPNENNWKQTTVAPQNKVTTKKPTLQEQSLRAVMELAIIIGVAFLVGGGFMAMVGLEILCDKMTDKYHEIFKKEKQLTDIERMHPAELVGTFSRYK